MRKPSLARFAAAVIALSLLALGEASAACTTQRLTVERAPLDITLCLRSMVVDTQAGSRTAHIDATYTTPGRRVVQALNLILPSQSGAGRAPASIALAPLGLTGTIHLTLLIDSSQAQVDAALLTPGAVILK
ncbi:MAG TPA: hypothetical protein VMV73_03105 [Candidatus Dormibacteraeota bacterium]|nr:hypothetical protein [Candidatus Dormibacteraeota bacterium]